MAWFWPEDIERNKRLQKAQTEGRVGRVRSTWEMLALLALNRDPMFAVTGLPKEWCYSGMTFTEGDRVDVHIASPDFDPVPSNQLPPLLNVMVVESPPEDDVKPDAIV
jgi:hypothetical protein